ncbi:MAG: hypothetical protein HOV87_17375 [Catenulispora sp.]|nr:hypothetical protein [Catenulispora sp.]
MSRSLKTLGDQMLGKLVPKATAQAAGCGGDSWTEWLCTHPDYYSRECYVVANCTAHCGPWEYCCAC